jgi:hypothetical protein
VRSSVIGRFVRGLFPNVHIQTSPFFGNARSTSCANCGVVSAVAVYADGSVIEMATIGREGCSSVQAVFGAKSSSVRLLVQRRPQSGRGD